MKVWGKEVILSYHKLLSYWKEIWIWAQLSYRPLSYRKENVLRTWMLESKASLNNEQPTCGSSHGKGYKWNLHIAQLILRFPRKSILPFFISYLILFSCQFSNALLEIVPHVQHEPGNSFPFSLTINVTWSIMTCRNFFKINGKSLWKRSNI